MHRGATDWTPPAIPTLVVVPHPDDEVLLVGGLIATQRERGVPFHVLGVTDGEEPITTIAAEFPLVVAPWMRAHLVDHEACGRAAVMAIEPTAATLVFGLFWTWHEVAPCTLGRDELLAVAVPPHRRQQRARAIESHRSQVSDELTRPCLTPDLLEPLAWEHEYFLQSC